MPATTAHAPGVGRRRWQVLRIDVGPDRVYIDFLYLFPKPIFPQRATRE